MPPPASTAAQVAVRVTARGLGKRFGGHWIISDFNETFEAGEVIGIQGRNGSGKSTLLRLLSGQLTPSRGGLDWELAGSEVAREELYRHVSWTGPYTELVEELTVAEMLRFHFGLKPLRPGISVSEVPALIGLAGARDRPLLDCSSGMRQRLLLATALLSTTPLLLLDEPTITLDGPARAWFQEQLAVARVGRLVVIASNDMGDLAECSRVIGLG